MIPRERISARQWLPPWLRHQHIARYAWAAQYCRDARVLDAACANAYGSAMLVRAGARSVTGLDVAFEPIAEAVESRSHRPLVIGDGTRLPFEPAAFDVFVSFETIEHVRADGDFVAEARRVLRPGGVFVCSTPNRRLSNPGNSIEDRPFNPFHVREYTRPELGALLGRAFGQIEWYGQRRYESVYVAALCAAGRAVRPLAVKLHQLRKLASIPFDRASNHAPVPLTADGEAEVLIAVCR